MDADWVTSASAAQGGWLFRAAAASEDAQSRKPVHSSRNSGGAFLLSAQPRSGALLALSPLSGGRSAAARALAAEAMGRLRALTCVSTAARRARRGERNAALARERKARLARLAERRRERRERENIEDAAAAAAAATSTTTTTTTTTDDDDDIDVDDATFMDIMTATPSAIKADSRPATSNSVAAPAAAPAAPAAPAATTAMAAALKVYPIAAAEFDAERQRITQSGLPVLLSSVSGHCEPEQRVANARLFSAVHAMWEAKPKDDSLSLFLLADPIPRRPSLSPPRGVIVSAAAPPRRSLASAVRTKGH